MVRMFCAVLLLLTATTTAWAQDPVNAQVKLRFDEAPVITEPTRLVFVPDNGPPPASRIELEVVVKDPAGTPIPGAFVSVIFASQTTQHLCWCAAQPQANWILADGRKVFQAVTDATGLAVFQIGAGGCDDLPGNVIIRAGAGPDPQQGIQLRAYRYVASMDNTGAGALPCDLAVDVRDLVEYAIAHVGGSDSPCHDYTGDGAVNAADLVLYARHHVRHAMCP